MDLLEGDETLLDENESGLSGGQLQRISLARAIYPCVYSKYLLNKKESLEGKYYFDDMGVSVEINENIDKIDEKEDEINKNIDEITHGCVMTPQLLILDNPFSFIDPNTKLQIVKNLFGEHGLLVGITVLLICEPESINFIPISQHLSCDNGKIKILLRSSALKGRLASKPILLSLTEVSNDFKPRTASRTIDNIISHGNVSMDVWLRYLSSAGIIKILFILMIITVSQI